MRKVQQRVSEMAAPTGQAGALGDIDAQPIACLPLAVDLDNTLIKTDLLYETGLSLLSASPASALGLPGALINGKAAFKAYIAERAEIEPENLPYDAAVLQEIETARTEGREVVLVSASDQRYVTRISDHLGIFDGAFGSDGSRNLGGAEKARFLEDRYGAGNFAYIGDAKVDLPIWQSAGEAITIGASRSLQRAAEKTGPARHLSPETKTDRSAYLRALRPHQWMKNVLIFLPLMAAHQFDAASIMMALMAFVAFSLAASSVYVLNDLLDLAADRVHPRKRNRPFASGAVPLRDGIIMAPALLIAALLIAVLATEPLFVAVLGTYYLITMAYSIALKRKRVIDICTLAGLYAMRVIAGAAATGLPLSPWMLAFSVFLFLALAAVKRQAELIDGQANDKNEIAGRGYTINDLPVVEMMAIAAGYNAVLVLALYISSPATAELYESPLMLWGACPIVLYWISRIVMIAHNGDMEDDPVIFAVRDRISLVCGVGVLACAVAANLL